MPAVLLPVGVEGAIMARTSSPTDATSIAALIAMTQHETNKRRQDYWSWLRADTIRQTVTAAL